MGYLVPFENGVKDSRDYGINIITKTRDDFNKFQIPNFHFMASTVNLI